MFPTLIDFGTWNLPFFGETHLFLPTYGVLFAGAVLLAWWWFTRRARSSGLPDEQIFNLVFYTLLGGILGAKLLLIVIDWRFYLAQPFEIVGTLRSAGVLMGGVTCGALVFAWYARRCRLPLWHLADAMAAPLALAQGIGRLGCFAAGCCWGRPADPHSPLAVVFTNPLAAEQTGVSLNVPLFPVQLVQFAHDVLLAGVLTVCWRRRLRPDGTTFWIYVLVYSLGRGVIELWRGDRQRGLHFGDLLSTSQIIALAGFVAAALMLARGCVARARAAE